MSDGQTARLGMPMLQPGQAQKELYHNEALALIDIALHATVTAIGLDMPPASPTPGMSWIVGAAPTGAWAGAAHQLAGWTAGGWRFVVPTDGMTVWSLADSLEARFVGGSWIVGEARATRLKIGGVQVVGAQQAGIAPPSGGVTIDAEARTVLALILGALSAHGLIG